MYWHHSKEHSELFIYIGVNNAIKVAYVTDKKWKVSSNKCILDNIQGSCLNIDNGIEAVVKYLVNKEYFKEYTFDLGGLIRPLAALTIKPVKEKTYKTNTLIPFADIPPDIQSVFNRYTTTIDWVHSHDMEIITENLKSFTKTVNSYNSYDEFIDTYKKGTK